MQKPWISAAVGVGLVLAVRAALRRARRIDLRDRVVIVTGGSRGLGLLLCRELVDRGARLAICARDPDELDRAADELRARGGQVLAIRCDVTDPADVARFVGDVEDDFGPIDVLINNAGVVQIGPVDVMTIDDFDDALRAHLWAPLYMTRAVLPSMRWRRSGRIVNIASIGGKVPVPHLLPYCASKYALVGLSEGLRVELAKDGILVTTVCPGLMRTGSIGRTQVKGHHQAEYAWFAIAGSLPLLSMNAERAARRIIDACERGDAELIVGAPAKLAVRVHGVAPGLVQELFGLVDRVLPSADGAGTEAVEGRRVPSSLAGSPLTRLSDAAARRNNEL